MLILALSDIHCEFDEFVPKKMPRADAVVVSGDITNDGMQGDPQFVSQASAWLKELRECCGPVYWIPGNHDYGFDQTTFDHEGVACIHAHQVDLGALWLAGNGATPLIWPEGDNLTTRSPEEEEAVWSVLWRDGICPNIIVSHGPPQGACDYDNGEHLGSSVGRRYIERFQPSLFVCGHIHEGAGVGSVGRTVVVNTACGWRQIEVTDQGAVNVIA